MLVCYCSLVETGRGFSRARLHNRESSWAAVFPTVLTVITFRRDLKSANPLQLVEGGVMRIQLVANGSGMQRAADVPVLMRVRRNFWARLSYGDSQVCDLQTVDLRSSIGPSLGSTRICDGLQWKYSSTRHWWCCSTRKLESLIGPVRSGPGNVAIRLVGKRTAVIVRDHQTE